MSLAQEATSPSRRPGVLRAITFMIAGFPVRIAQFVAIVVFVAFGVPTTLIWVGIPVLMIATGMVRWFGDAERRWVSRMLNREIPAAERVPTEGGLLRRWLIRLSDPTTWRDLAYVLLMLPIGILEFVLGVVGIVIVPIGLFVVPAVGWLHANLAYALLGPDKARRAEARARRLQASRARGIDAAEAERRRIERDLHDGAQQRLLSVAMDIGRAKTKLDSDPEAARALLDEAHSDAKRAVSELRDLARGIYPAVLGDRGLDAALSAVAAKAPVPVQVEVQPELVTNRPPNAVETTAYFIVGEALTNIAKHARASRAEVAVWREDDKVVVQVTDDGCGGAEFRPGGGLAGLADRAATIDGVVTVVSPTTSSNGSGPGTVLRADLPCTW